MTDHACPRPTASRSLAQYGLPVHRMGIGDDGVSEMSMPTSVAGSGFVASAAFDSGSEYDAGSSTVAGVSKTLRLPAREFREVLDECARTEWTRPIHNTVPALPLIPPPPWPNAPLFRFMLHGTYGVPVTRDGLLWTQYVFGAGMYLFFVVAGFYDGSIVFSFAFGFLCLVILEEVSESAKMRSVHATRHINIVAPLWLAHTLAFVSIVLGFVVSIDLGRYFDEHRTGAVFGSVLPVACVLSVIAPVLLLATAPFCHPAQSIEIGLPVCSGLALATLLGLALHPSTPVGLVPFLQQASGTHGTIFYLLSPLATLTSIYSTVKAMRMRASWAALCSLLLIGNLKIHSFHLPQLIALARDAAAAASVTNMTFLEGRRPDLVYNASAHSETLLQTAEFRRIRTRSALDDASIATAVVAVLFYIVAIRRDVAQRYQFSTARYAPFRVRNNRRDLLNSTNSTRSATGLKARASSDRHPRPRKTLATSSCSPQPRQCPRDPTTQRTRLLSMTLQKNCLTVSRLTKAF